MHINKITNFTNNHQAFKGYTHKRDYAGNRIESFYYPHDSNAYDCYVEFYPVKENIKEYAGFEVLQDKRIGNVKIEGDSVEVNINELLNIDSDEPYAYRIVLKNKGTDNVAVQRADTGIGMLNGQYTLVTRFGTTPLSSGGRGVLTMLDNHQAGKYYHGFGSDKVGEITYDNEKQLKAENTKRTYNNIMGGNLAGLEDDLDNLAKKGITDIYLCPFGGGDNVSYHGYWNENLFQMSRNMGTMENFESLVRKLAVNGQKIMFDATLTSEGLQGRHLQYSRRWGEKDPQAKYWFAADSVIEYATVPENHKNLRHKVENLPFNFTQDDKGFVKFSKNENYKPNQETWWHQTETNDKQDKLGSNSYQDSAIPYTFLIADPEEYKQRLIALSEYNKTAEKPIMVDSAEGTLFLTKFANWSISKDGKGMVRWDDNADMALRRHFITAYDEQKLQEIESIEEREIERQKMIRGSYETRDMDYQAVKFWAEKFKDIAILTYAQNLKGANTVKSIKDLIKAEQLPKDAEKLTSDALEMISEDLYALEPKGQLSKDDVTLKALMKLPIESLEVADITTGVLGTSFFSSYGINEETIGKSRFELMKEGNPHVTEPYASTYKKVEKIFTEDLKDFADKVIAEINKESSEKLLKADGSYTEYGEYVINLIGQNIAKYALLKSLAGESFGAQIDKHGVIHYDYDKIRENTSLKALGIYDQNPIDEAAHLSKIIKNGLKTLTSTDVDTLVKATMQQIDGVTLSDFRISEAISMNIGRGMGFRIDAYKDMVDMDAVKNGSSDFDTELSKLIEYGNKLTQAIKSVDDSAEIIYENTDIGNLIKETYGSTNYNDLKAAGARFKDENDAVLQLVTRSGGTSEAAYSYFFSSIIRLLSQDFEEGNVQDGIHKIFEILQTISSTRDVDFMRKLFTFIGNHDKGRVIHNFALNLGQFYSSFSTIYKNGDVDFKTGKWARQQALMLMAGVDKIEDLPLEFKMNINNLDYFRTLNPKAVAMGTLISQAMNQVITSGTDAETKDYLKRAIAEVTNGKYLGRGESVERQVLKDIPELSSLDKAFEKILSIAEEKYKLAISEDEKKALISQITTNANDYLNYFASEKAEDTSSKEDYENVVNSHLVKGDFNWEGKNKGQFANANRMKLIDVLKGDESKPIENPKFEEHNLYTVCLASLLKQEFLNAKGSDDRLKSPILNAIRDFTLEYNAEKVKAISKPLSLFETGENAMRKDGFAATEIDTAIEMVIEHAEYLARKECKLKDDEHFENIDDIYVNTYQAAVEPAVQKAGIAFTLLSAIFGCFTYYAGDELAATGGERKTKNIDNQNRNARKVSRLKEGKLQEFTTRVNEFMNQCMDIRQRDGVGALLNGTPYIVKACGTRPKKNPDDKEEKFTLPAILMMDEKGNFNISVLNVEGIQRGNRVKYSGQNEFSISTLNPYVPVVNDIELDYIELATLGNEDHTFLSLLENTEFRNTDIADGAKYIVQKGLGKAYVVIKEGGKILLNKLTARNGAMVLKKVPVFKGRSGNINQQYNVSNPIYNSYSLSEQSQVGNKLSLISK